MRTNVLKAGAALALVGFIYAVPAIAQDKGTTAPGTNDTHSMGNMGEGMGKGKMNMENMKGMMSECKGMNKDGKMCHQEMMQKCQKEMSKGECDKMMKHAKAQDDSTKKK